MRAHTCTAIVAAFISFAVTCSAPAAGAPLGSASLAYQNRASDMFVRAVLPALAQRLDQLLAAGATKVYYRIRADGQNRECQGRVGTPQQVCSGHLHSRAQVHEVPADP